MRRRSFSTWRLLLTLVLSTGLATSNCLAQDASPAPGFAASVLTTIEPQLDRGDALSVHDLVEIRAREDLAWTPASTAVSRTLFLMAQDAVFPQDIWCLEFTFKPLRMIEVDVPQRDGQLARKLIWYMVYRVRNTGAAMIAEPGADGRFTTSPGAVEKIRFIPQLVLSVHDGKLNGADDQKTDSARHEYLDRIVPAALDPIGRREMPRGQLLNSVPMAQALLQADPDGRGLWGVAMWEGIDPETDFFSVYVRGLTNAYQWQDGPAGTATDKAPGKGRSFARKALQLNFWRPGDEYGEDEREVRYGVPAGKASLYNSGEGVAYRWVFR